jgi:hypothetical protein
MTGYLYQRNNGKGSDWKNGTNSDWASVKYVIVNETIEKIVIGIMQKMIVTETQGMMIGLEQWKG